MDLSGWYVSDNVTGETVTPTTALGVTAVYACVRVIAETIGTLPLYVYQRLNGDTNQKQRANAHMLYRLLRWRPNPAMSAVDFLSCMQAHATLRGNAYAVITRNNRGEVTELYPWHPDHVRIVADGWKIAYELRVKSGGVEILPANRVFHLRGMSGDGIVGYDPITLASNAVGLCLASEKFGARFFKNGSVASGVFKHPGKLSDNAMKNLQESLSNRAGDGAFRAIIVQEGMDWSQISITPEQGQFLQTRQFQLNEIARMFRVPPHMIGDLSRATFSNVEQQSIDFVQHTIRPWMRIWESAISTQLLRDDERDSYFAEFLVDELLRGDSAARWATYSTAVDKGILSVNEVRARENLNPRDGGDEYYHPLNLGVGDGKSESDDETA